MLPFMGGMFASYLGAIKVSDGGFGEMTNAKRILCYQKNGIKEFITDGKTITGVIYRRGRKIIEHMITNRFHKGYAQFNEEPIPGPVVCNFRPGTWREVLHGISTRKNVRLFCVKGDVKTMYSCGRFLWQEFRYKNRRLAYRFKLRDQKVIVKYPDGKIAGILETGRAGFQVSSPWKDRRSYGNEKVSVRNGEVVLPFENGFRVDVEKFDFSKSGNCKIQFWNNNGRTAFKGEYQNRQRVGEWVVNGKRVYLINGVAVEKKLWDTPPEKMSIAKVLKISNAQLRMALMARIGYKRLTEELKHKVIHEDKKRRNKLIQLPIKVSNGAGNGNKPSWLRILIVTCTSTRQKYYLNVPDYVAPHGKRIYLNTCEQARQWTFHNEDPRNNIKFHLET